ncbi:deoxynucleotidyltransferase terminal-interacting protein 2-like [Acropora palmata]
MRRSKRLAARKGVISETEGSSQKDVVETTKKDEDFSNLKDPVSTHDFIIDKTPSKVVFGLDLGDKIRFVGYDSNDREIVDDSREKGDDGEGKDDKRTRVVGRRRGLRNLSDHEEEEEEEDFITLSTLSEKTVGKNSLGLSSELQVDIDAEDLYLKFDKGPFKPVILNQGVAELSSSHKELMKKSVITSDFEKRNTLAQLQRSKYAKKKQRKKEREETAGPMWFNLPRTQMTPEIEQDLKIIKMRNVLDRTRHYKKNDSQELPKYFQIGTVVEGSADFYASRIPKRQRKNNMIDELLADAEFRRYNKKKFLEIQTAKQSGKRRFSNRRHRRKGKWSKI